MEHIMNIKQKLINNHSMVVKADKGNTLIIFKEDHYINKLDNFINNNDFTELAHDITTKLQQITRNCINSSKNIIRSSVKSKYTYKYESQRTTHIRYYQITWAGKTHMPNSQLDKLPCI
jgi:hypothetical protein